MRILWVLSILSVCSACGPVQYVRHVTIAASRAVSEAQHGHAAELAPYEYTLATERLHKARELGGYARYHEAIELGKKAEEAANKARSMSLEKNARPNEGDRE